MYLYVHVSLLGPDCVVCVISDQSTSKIPRYMSDLSKLGTLHKTYKVLLVLMLQGSACVDTQYH